MTIDITPTWESLVLIMAELYSDSRDDTARKELLRMAHIADLYVAEHKDDKPISEEIDGYPMPPDQG